VENRMTRFFEVDADAELRGHIRRLRRLAFNDQCRLLAAFRSVAIDPSASDFCRRYCRRLLDLMTEA
jgi:hypothetical protein